jgi:hypothetical protein
MASLGGWARLVVGLVLSAEILREWAFGGGLANWAIGLAAIYIGLTAAYFVAKF